MKVHRMRTCAATVSFVYFFTNAAMAHTPETNLWAERRRHTEINRTNNKNNVHLASLPSIPTVPKIGQSLSLTNANNILSEEVTKTLPKGFVAQHADLFSALPTTHGTIRKIWLPADGPGKRVVIYIQDVHQNEEAQQHIAGAVESLLQARQAGLLALEGAFDVIDVRAYHDFEDREVIGLTADCLLRENFITGPVHAAMTTTANLPPLLGVDDPVHYNANVNAYRQSAPKIGVFKKDLAARKFNLEKTKSSVFSTALSSFDAKVTAYKEDRLPLSEYVIALAPESGVGQAGLFLQALSIEKKLDFQKVEADRKKLIETLVNHLSKQQIDQLVQESAGYRMGQVRYGEFYRDLQSLCRSAKIDLAKYPHMDNYIRYVLLSDRIDTEKLIDELATLQTTRYQTLAKTPREKELVVQSTTLQLTARLLDFALTPAEWADYEQLNSKPTGFPDLTSFEAFYKEAHARDTAITENLLKTMDAHQANTALLVTGGYHSPGVAHRLRQAGVTVIAFTPRIEKVDTLQGSAYLSVFTQEKTPLEKLFAGEKLSVSPDPGVQATQTTGAILAVGVAAVKNGIPAANKTLNWFLGGITKVTIAMKDGTAYLKVKREGLKNGVQFRVVSSPKGFQFTQTALTAFFGLALAYALFPKMQWVFTTMTSLFTNTISMDPFWNIMIAVTLLVLSNSNRPFFPSFLRSSDVSKQHQSNNKLQNELGEISLMSEDGSIAQNKLFTTNGAEGQKSKELGDIEKRYLRLLTLVRELGWVVFKKRLVSILKLTPSISVDDFQKHMRETLTMGLYDLTVRTKKLSPLEAFQTLVRFSRWLDFPDAEYKALNEMAQRAINKKTPPDVKEEIRSFLENRAQTHLNKNTGDKIKRWVRIHKLMDQWSRKEVRPVGKTGYTDWHVLVFLQLFLADYLDSQESMTTLNFDLNSLDPKIISMLNIGQIRNKIESRASEGAVRAMSSDWGVARSVTNKREKMPFIKKLSQEKITKLLSDEAFFDRFLYFLYIAHQELIDLEESSSPTPVSPGDVKTMLKKLQRKITEIPTKSNEAVNLKFLRPPG